MEKSNKFRFILSICVAVLIVAGFFFITQCGGGDNDNDQQNSTIKTYELSLGGVADNVNLTAGQTTSISFVGHTPGPLRTYKTVTLNLQKILDAGYVETASLNRSPLLEFLSKATSPSLAMAAYQWEVSLRVGDADDLATVCEEGQLYGPYTVSGVTAPEIANTESISAEPSTVDLINFGQFAMCIQVSSPMDLSLSIHDYSVDVTVCDIDPVDFQGTWTGTYTCTNVGCEGQTNLPITLTITQDGHSAQYTDSEASYRGTVCGNEFVFNGGVDGEWGYEEKGTAILNSDGSLRKVSSFVSYDGSCRGDCEDLLYRQE